MIMQNQVFLPSLNQMPLQANRGSTNSNHAATAHCYDSNALTLRNHLSSLAQPKVCLAGKQAKAMKAPFAFGSMVSSWMKPYMWSVEHNYSFWSPPISAYQDGDGKTIPRNKRCPRNDWSCFFDPLSKCEFSHHLEGCGKSGNENSPVGFLQDCVVQVSRTDADKDLDR
jgi:hypothetical protein